MGRWHAAAAERAGARIVAVTDPDPARAAWLARRHGGRAVDPATLLTGHNLDAAHVCTPLDTHAAIVADLLGAGVPVLVEKPLARDTAETERLVSLARAARVPLCPVHQFPFQPGARRILSAPERLGTLLHADYVACSAGGRGGPTALDDVVADILPHPLSLLWRVLPGPPDAWTWRTMRSGAGEFRAYAVTGAASASLLISMGGRPTRNTLRLVGTGGTAHLDLFHGFATVESAAVSRARKVSRPFTHAGTTLAAATVNLVARTLRREPAYPGLRELIERFYRAVRSGGAPPITSEEALDVARTRDLLTAGPGPGA
jgi:predicted dehydrogenase